MFGLLGPNGAGKTSSIRMMMGITMPDSGQVSLFEKPFERKSLERVGYLPEERGLYKKMKVIDQLVFFGELHGLAADESRKRAVDWAERMEIADSLPKKTEELSKGMQQKIQFIGIAPARSRTDRHGRALLRPRSGQRHPARAHAARTQGPGQGDPVLHPSHGPGGEALRLHLPGQQRRAPCSPDKMREIKSRYERNRVIVEFEGDASFLNSAEIAEAKNFSGHAEIRLQPHGDAQKLLHEAAAVATIYRFELVEPSLEEIFIQTVGGKADA